MFFRIKELGGGAILDLGSYGVDILQWIFQEDPQCIKANGTLNDDGVDTDVEAEFSYSRGRKGTFKLSINVALKNTLKIVGTKATLEVMFYATS